MPPKAQSLTEQQRASKNSFDCIWENLGLSFFLKDMTATSGFSRPVADRFSIDPATAWRERDGLFNKFVMSFDNELFESVLSGWRRHLSFSLRHFGQLAVFVTVNVNKETAATTKQIVVELLDKHIPRKVFPHMLAVQENHARHGCRLKWLFWVTFVLARTQDCQPCLCPRPQVMRRGHGEGTRTLVMNLEGGGIRGLLRAFPLVWPETRIW